MVSVGKKSASPVPSGGSPDGTGQWPVPPMVINALSGRSCGSGYDHPSPSIPPQSLSPLRGEGPSGDATGILGALAANVTCCKSKHLHNVFLKSKAVGKWQLGMACPLLWSRRDCGQTGGGAFVPDGTLDKETREPSDQSLGYSLSPSGLDGGSPASEASLAGFWKTGSLAANGSGTFPAFIFKNALAAYIRFWGIADFRLPIADCRLRRQPVGLSSSRIHAAKE